MPVNFLAIWQAFLQIQSTSHHQDRPLIVPTERLHHPNRWSIYENRQTAMNMLKAKLYELEESKKAKEKAALEGVQLDIGWGSQIRSYVFHPYSMVKDHRTNQETANVQGVMDGDLDPFIDAYLQFQLGKENPD